MKERVYIAVPTLDGRIECTLAHLLSRARQVGHGVEYFIGYRPVDYMRNTIFRDFLESGCARLWMLDSDVLPPPNALEMLSADGDIVTASVTGHDWAADGVGLVLKNYRVAGAAMLIRREVLADRRLWLDPEPDVKPEDWAASIYRVRTTPWGKLTTTGDVDLCQRVVKLGYAVNLWCDGMFGQRESLDLRAVAMYGARCAADAATTKVAV